MSLKFGQTIKIKSYERKGYITSKSYTDSNLYFQINDHTNNYIEDNQQILDIMNYRQSLYQILPTSSFEINDEMNSMKSEAKKAESAPRAKTEQEQFKAIIAQKRGKQINFGDRVVFKHLDSQYYIYGSFECARSGIGAFKIQLRNQLSQKIIFKLVSYRTYEKEGDSISLDAPLMIYHPETQCFVSYVQERIFIDRDYKFNQRQMFGMSQINDKQLAIPKPYIKSFRMFPQKENKQLQKENKQLPVSGRYEIINQNIAKRVWRLEQHLQMQMKPIRQQIRNHDVVYFIHTKDDKYLCPSNYGEDVFLKKRKGEDVGQIFDGLWEIEERKETEQKFDEKSSVRKFNQSVRKNQIEDAGISTQISKEKYIIRHLTSGRIMFASRDYSHVSLEEFKRDNTLKPMLFECVDSKLSDGVLVRFSVKASTKTARYLCVQKQQKKQAKIKDSSPSLKEEDSIIQQKVDEIEKTYESYFQKENCQLMSQISEHGFRIYKVDEEDRRIVLFLMSSQQILFKFTKFIQTFEGMDELLNVITVTFLNNIITVMRSLIGFVYDCEYHKIAMSGNSPIVKRQRSFEELGMIQLVTLLVNQINNRNDELKLIAESKYNKQSQYTKIRNIYTLGYEILECVAANNYTLKIRISKYLQNYLTHIRKRENKVVYKSLQEILDGNNLALQRKIDPEYIKLLIQSFDKQNPDPADLQFLSRLSVCKERTVVKNQVSIFQNFYNSQQDGPNKFKFREDQLKMQIASRISETQPSQFRTLPEMYQQCQISQLEGSFDPEKGHWNYFLEYLNLLADVCVHRNNLPLNYIHNNLPLKTLVYFLKEPVVKKKLLFQPFIRLVHHAFIENSVYEEMNRITKVKDWNNLQYFQIPKSKEVIVPELASMLGYIEQYIRKINLQSWQKKGIKKKQVLTIQKNKDEEQQTQPTSIQFDPQDPSRLKMVRTFLQIFKSTLALGFWPSMDALKKIVPYMLKILSFDIQYTERELNYIKDKDIQNDENRHLNDQDYKNIAYGRVKQQLTLNKPSINNLVQCKMIAAQILDIIADYQYNIKVSIITKYFKDVIEMEIDLSRYTFDRGAFLKKWFRNKQFHLFKPQNYKEDYLMIEQIWIDKIKQIIQQRDLFSECVNIDKFLVFFQTFIYENKQLSNLILSLMTKISNQRKNILNTFRNIIIVSGGTLSKLAGRVLITRTILLPLSNFNVREAKMTQQNSLWKIVISDPHKSEQMLSRSLGSIQQLAFLTMAMKKNCKPTSQKASKLYNQQDLYPYNTDDENQSLNDRSYLIITETEENNQLNQNLIKSQDHHLIILEFIKIMSEIPKEYPLPSKALHAAYNFLTVLVWNNFENKEHLFRANALKIAECHLSQNVGCIDFYKQMYTNNKTLVLKNDVSLLVNRIIQISNGLLLTSYHKSKLMDFLRVLVIFDEKGIDRNQNIVMEIISLYQVSDNNQIVYLKTPNDLSMGIQNHFDKWISLYSLQYTDSIETYSNLYIGPQIFYIATFFSIFSALIENQNVVNIGKCNNMHPYDFLVAKLSKSQYCWPVIRHLRAYMNKLYYFEKREKDSQLFEAFLTIDLDNIKRQLRGIVQLRCNCPNYSIIKIVNPIRYTYLASYVYLTLEEILHSLDLMFKNADFDLYITTSINQNQQNTKNPLYFKILEIIQMLQYLLKTMDGRYINNYLNKVSGHLKKVAQSIVLEVIQEFNEYSRAQIKKNQGQNLAFDDVPFKKRYVFHQSKGFWRHLIDWNSFHEQQIQRQKTINSIQKKSEKDTTSAESKESEQQKKKEYLLELLFLGNIEKKIGKKIAIPKKNQNQLEQKQQQIVQEQVSAQAALPKNLVTSKSSRFKIKNERFPNMQVKNSVINSRRKKLVKFIEINPTFKQFSEEETQNTLYSMFNQLNNESKKAHFDMVVVGKSDVIKSIVKMNKLNPYSLNNEHKLVIIELLTNYISRISPGLNKDVSQLDFWNQSDAEKQKIKEAQNFLNQCGCSEFICSLLMNDFTISTSMSNSILLFAIMMLIGKNTSVQNSLLLILKNDQKNVVFVELQKLIKDCTIVVASNSFDPVEQEYNEQSTNYADTYDYYNNQDNCMKRKFKFEPITIMEQREFTQKYQFLQTAFIFLKVLCEGNNSQIKDYIREQTYNQEEKRVKQQSINFIGLATTQLKKIFDNISLKIIKVPFCIVDFLNEVTQIPCLQNQLFLCQSSFFHDFCHLAKHLQQTKVIPFNYQNLKILNRFYSLNFKNIISCLEGNKPQIRQLLSTEDLCTYYVNAFSFSLRNLEEADPSWKGFTNANQLQLMMSNYEYHKNLIIDLFQITAVIKKLKHLNSKNESFLRIIEYQLTQTKMKEYFKVFQNNMYGIEVHVDSFDNSDEGQNQLLFFPKHAVFNYLSRETRAKLMEVINRSTQRDKIIGLVKAKEDINQEITYGYFLDHDYKMMGMKLSISNNKIQVYKRVGMNLATLLIILLPFLAQVTYYPQDEEIQYYLGSFTQFINVLSLIQFSFAFIYFMLWLKSRVKLAEMKYARARDTDTGAQRFKVLEFLFKIPLVKGAYCLLTYEDQLPGVMLFLSGSFLGTFYGRDFFSILLINLMIDKLDVLKNIIAAITINMKMLGMLSFLGGSFVAIFSIFSINSYSVSLYPEQIPKQHCEKIMDCIVELYIREEIGNDMDKFESGRFFFDMLYTVFMDTMFGNIVGGVLIDTFAQLRDKRSEIENDKKGLCFICGVQRQTLEKKNQTLKKHYQLSCHKLWNYVFYLCHLDNTSNKTGLQNIIMDKVKKQDVTWIPTKAEEKFDIGAQIAELQSQIKKQEEIISKIQASGEA